MRPVSRRDFLKIGAAGGLGLLTSRQLSRAGEAGEVVLTTCSGCPAGCGLAIRRDHGAILAITGNTGHPLNQGRLCAGSRRMLTQLDPRGRAPFPMKRVSPARFRRISWEEGSSALAAAWQTAGAGETAYLLGSFPDHLWDLVQQIARLQNAWALRGAGPAGHAAVVLQDAARRVFSRPTAPSFDLEPADLIVYFGQAMTAPWLPPGAKASQPYNMEGIRRIYCSDRRPDSFLPGAFWIPTPAGKMHLLAEWLERRSEGGASTVKQADVQALGLVVDQLQDLARLWADARRPLAIPGLETLAGENGPRLAQAILRLNAGSADMFFTPEPPLHGALPQRTATQDELAALVEQMRSGRIKLLVVHGADPFQDLAPEINFGDAVRSVELIVSLSAWNNQANDYAHYILPDRVPLESWGYQKVKAGLRQEAVSALQPILNPALDTRPAATVLLQAVQIAGGELARRLPYRDEFDFIQSSLAMLLNRGAVYPDRDFHALWSNWRASGGWWMSAKRS